MKHCRKCDTTKEKSHFSRNSRKKDGLQGYCKMCCQLINADTYLRLPKRRAKIRENNAKMVAKNKRFIYLFRRLKGCIFCDEREPVALDFHHLDPKNKDLEVSKLVYYSLTKVKEEIRKCVVLCSNCHRKHHAGITGFKL